MPWFDVAAYKTVSRKGRLFGKILVETTEIKCFY